MAKRSVIGPLLMNDAPGNWNCHYRVMPDTSHPLDGGYAGPSKQTCLWWCRFSVLLYRRRLRAGRKIYRVYNPNRERYGR